MAAQVTMLTSRAGILIKRAFTFVEVIVALAVVSISLLALLKLNLLSINIADRAQLTSRAVFLAEQKIAEALAKGYPPRGAESGTEQNAGVTLNWHVDIADAALPQLRLSNVRDLRKITVEVGWKSGSSRSGNSIRMSTYVSKKSFNENQPG